MASRRTSCNVQLLPDTFDIRPRAVPVYLQCGVCGFTFNTGDHIISLHGIFKSKTVQTQDLGGFPKTRYSELGGYMSLQRGWIAYPRDTSSEYATVHADCLRLFTRTCRSDDGIHRLWIAACWRRPWFEADPLNLSPGMDIIAAMHRAADVCEMPQLRSMPNEISQMIWNQTPTISLWRYSSVLQLAAALSETNQIGQILAYLGDVFSWQRGSAPVIERCSAKPIVRLTIDAQGLRKIERLSEMPKVGKFRSENMVYIVRPIPDLAGVLVTFRVTRPWKARGSYEVNPQLYMGYTNAASPPTMPPIYTHYLFIDSFRIHRYNAIHGHTSEEPSALPTWKRLMHIQQQDAIWVHLPFSKEDYITAFGIRLKMFDGRGTMGMPSFLVRMSKSGDISLGPYHKDSTQDFLISAEDRPTLVHDVLELGSLSTFGAYPHTKEKTQIHPRQPCGRPFHKQACFSSAPLQGVSKAEIFYEKDTGMSKGILLEYDNGGRRALGQCRLGVAGIQVTGKPGQLCLTDYSDIHQTAISFTAADSQQHRHEKLGWRCYEMKGTLESWTFGSTTTFKVIMDDSSTVHH
ncbi:hypothetical protein BGZ63DRAFT_449696 [Mariannaea sp. PMI_226]|nr:hypothetical protein BGZ63DRAFT_449696 [Mariannaea sp. PMI_226]